MCSERQDQKSKAAWGDEIYFQVLQYQRAVVIDWSDPRADNPCH